MDYTEAFTNYGATLTNPLWSVSAFARDGSLVLCLWEGYLRRGKVPRTLEYRDTLSKWLGNVSGKNEIQDHLYKAKENSLPIRLVIAHPVTEREEKLVGKVADESNIKKTFSVKEDAVGVLEEFDGDTLLIVFRKAT